MSNRFIFFDCMETLIDMTEIPDQRMYALWAFKESGVEKYWDSVEEFMADYLFMRKYLKHKEPFHKEYSLEERLKIVVERKLGSQDPAHNREIVNRLTSSFWNKYVERCYVDPEIKLALNYLQKKGYNMAVISNFLVVGGIQQLLALLNIDHYFQFVLTSVEEGWRKPHPNIYNSGLVRAQCNAQDVVFIGDDYKNDYLAPQELGFKAILYDKQKLYPDAQRIVSFKEIEDYF
ncbi:MAG: HAD family hydrolase [Peptococcaceae bacterium]|jgi:putative hydrolase of the HAD superfamily|nr:HAD family hydrolase [Peptococcaceae bacterium]